MTTMRSWALRFWSAVLMLTASGLAIYMCTYEGNGYATVLGNGVIFGFGFVLGLCLWSTRITLDRATGELVIWNPVRRTRFLVSDVASVSARNGLEITLRSGATLASTAFGGSGVGLLTGNRKARGAVSTIQSYAEVALLPRTSGEAATRVRPIVLGAPLIVLTFVAGLTALHAIAT